MSADSAFLGRALERCRRVVAGADELIPLFGSAMPFAGGDLGELSLVERAAATAFLKRFEQLQDLVSRTARAVAAWEGEDAAGMTHRDLGDWPEKRSLLGDAEEWMVAVRLRNRLAHEYPIEEEEQVRRLNESWEMMPLLRDVAAKLDAYARGKGSYA